MNSFVTLWILIFVTMALLGVSMPSMAHSDESAYFRQIKDADESFVENELRALRRGELEFGKARLLLHAIGSRGRQDVVPLLKEVAVESARHEVKYKLSFDALHSLWALGENADYFLGNAAKHVENKWLAYYSILILAYEPNDTVVDKLADINDEAEDNHIQGAISKVRYVNGVARRYVALTEIEQKVSFLAKHASAGWNPIHIEEFEPTGLLTPEAVWARKQLLLLYAESREQVEEQLSLLAEQPGKIGLSRESGDPFFEYVKSYLAETSHSKSVEDT